MTEEKPKILKKVEELSGHLAEFMDNCDSIDKVMMPSLVDKDQVLFWPDFLVDPDPGGCTCFYGGETLHCTKNTTKIFLPMAPPSRYRNANSPNLRGL